MTAQVVGEIFPINLLKLLRCWRISPIWLCSILRTGKAASLSQHCLFYDFHPFGHAAD